MCVWVGGCVGVCVGGRSIGGWVGHIPTREDPVSNHFACSFHVLPVQLTNLFHAPIA